MYGHLNEYLVATNGTGRDRPYPSAYGYLEPRGLWRARLRRSRRGRRIVIDSAATRSL